jgi:hypothetical protein
MDGPDLDRPRLGAGVSRRNLDGLLEAAALDDVESADRLLGLGERTVGDDRLSIADADGACLARRSQLVAADPDAPRLEVFQPAEEILVSRVARVGLGRGVILAVPAGISSPLLLVVGSSLT